MRSAELEVREFRRRLSAHLRMIFAQIIKSRILRNGRVGGEGGSRCKLLRGQRFGTLTVKWLPATIAHLDARYFARFAQGS